VGGRREGRRERGFDYGWIGALACLVVFSQVDLRKRGGREVRNGAYLGVLHSESVGCRVAHGQGKGGIGQALVGTCSVSS
jgi:hypothetical protein